METSEVHAPAAAIRNAIVAGLILSWIPGTALALGSPPTCRLIDYDATQRADPEGAPTAVGVGVYVLALDHVDAVDQTFRLDAFVRLSWRDPRLAAAVMAAGVRECRFPLADVWEPRVIIYNQRDMTLELPDIVTVDSDGKTRYLQRVQGTVRSPMDLRDFPLDRQVLPLTFASFEYGPESVSLEFDETGSTRKLPTVHGWRIDEVSDRSGALEVEAAHEAMGGQRFARFDYRVHVRREIAYYMWRVIGPLTFIVLMPWAVFWIDPGNPNVQIGLASTSILTLIAFLFSLNNVLPPLSYLTRMDAFLFSSLALAFVAFGEAVMTAVVAARGRERLALRVDRWARWIFPIAFAGLQLTLWTT